MFIAFLVLLAVPKVIFGYTDDEILYDFFPADFKWACATSAYQIEGGWNEDGKGVNIWDTFAAVPGNILDGSDGKIACDSYHKYQEDVALLKSLGVHQYRFSISWSRVLPQGTGAVNEKGIEYYRNLTQALLDNGIEPMVTLYHWDLPQALEDHGGWHNSSSAEWFREFADVMFSRLGDKVKFWITLNEPWVVAFHGYGTGEKAPGVVGNGTGAYLAGHNLLRAHAMAYHLYNDNYKATQGGRIGITLNIAWHVPKDETQQSKDAAVRGLEFDLGWFANPVFVNGDYPAIMRQQIDRKDQEMGLTTKRLPEFTPEEKRLLNGSADFFGMNFYTSSVAEDFKFSPAKDDFNEDKDIKTYPDPTWYQAGSSWLYITPFGIREQLKYIKENYGDNTEIYITENGCSDTAGNLDDFARVYYYKRYINNVLKAIRLDQVNVKGYAAWSLMDNFEWSVGYTEKFGIHSVDFNNPERPRTMKESAKLYQKIVNDNGFVEEETCVTGGSKTVVIPFLLLPLMVFLCITMKH
ncbi:lactase/phlorizin hydrolase-like [Artemia franciscana]|uniref:lactase/phlorizin hydrolase-like n=1 Tax=Artemia franciscana TaxID=6661 RepID=UPI0032DA699F